MWLDLECPICEVDFSSSGEHPFAKESAYDCPICGSRIFAFSDDWFELRHYFGPTIGGKRIGAIFSWSNPEAPFRLAEFGPGEDPAWFVYVSRRGEFMIYKGLAKYKYRIDPWEFVAAAVDKRVERAVISIRQKDGSFEKHYRAHIIEPTWNGRIEDPDTIIEHLNDDRSLETAGTLSKSTRSRNITNFHAAKRSGELPRDQMVSRFKTPRWIGEELSRLTDLSGKELDQYVAHLLRLEISRLKLGET